MYEKKIEIKNGIWTQDFKPNFEIEIADTSKFYDVFLETENSYKFKTQNLWLFYQIKSPTNKIQYDTIEYMLFDEKGVPLGKDFLDEISYKLVYKSKIKFPEQGKYTLEITEGMRQTQAPLISELNLVVKYAQ